MEKTLLIIGGSSDIALEYIRCYHERYDTIVATYFNNKQLLDSLPELGCNLIDYKLDLRVPEELRSFLDFIREKELDPQYILFFSAGKTVYTRITDIDLEAVADEFQLETLAFLSIMKEFSSGLKKNKFGRIGVVASSVTKSAVALNTSYMVNKYALLGAVKAVAAELASFGVTANAVSPSMVDTKFIEGKSPFVIKKNIEASPLKRLATSHDVARTLAFIMDDENEFITGENIAVTGGSVK